MYLLWCLASFSLERKVFINLAASFDWFSALDWVFFRYCDTSKMIMDVSCLPRVRTLLSELLLFLSF